MTRTAPRLTAELLDRSLSVPTTVQVPADLHASIVSTVRESRRSGPQPGSGLAAAFGRLSPPMRVAITMLLLLGLIVGLAAVGAQLSKQRARLDDSLTYRGDAARTGVVAGPGPDGTIFLASGGRGDPWRITVFDPSGAVLRRIGEGILREPVLLAPGPDGEIYATDGTDRLDLFTAGGELKASWSGRDLELAVIGPEQEVYATGLAGTLRRYELPPGPKR